VELGKKSRAIRGGGGNFGVVTQFQFKLHEVGAEILAGLIVFPFHQAKQVLTQYREFVESAPEELNWKSHNFTELGDGALNSIIESAGKLPSPQCEIFHRAHRGRSQSRSDRCHGISSSQRKVHTQRTWAMR
jgi:hypothetical protein